MIRIAMLLPLFYLAACSSRPVPKGIILPEQMQKIVYDLVKVDEFINGFAVRDTIVDIKTKRITMYEQVFSIHHTTREEFYKSYNYYQQHPDKHKLFIDSLHDKLDRKVNEVNKPKMVKPMELTKPPR